MKRYCIAVILLCITAGLFAQEDQSLPVQADSDRFYSIGLGPEINSITRKGVAFGAAFVFGFDLPLNMAAGIKAVYSNDFDTVSSIGPSAFFRYNLPLPVSGFFVQAEAGAIILFEQNKASPAFSGGVAAGWRYVFKDNWYIEPYFRGGYPFAWGAGLTAGYRIPQKSRQTAARPEIPAEISNRRETLAEELTSILEEQNIADTSVEVSEEGVTLRLSNILFYADSSRMHETEEAKIAEIAAILRSLSGIKILVAGHTADTGTGSRAGDLRLSHNRAMAVMDLLIRYGAIDERNISVIGYGSDRPIADNSTEEGRAANRRVEIIILE